MSRIGKKPIIIPEKVEIKIEGDNVAVKGPKGELSFRVNPEIKVEVKEGKMFVSPKSEDKELFPFWGLARAILANNVKGVTEGFEKKLEIEGLGYKAVVDGDNLTLNVGFTHPVKIKCPAGIKFAVAKNLITVSGIDKNLVGQVASKIRKVKPVEPYKGKGLHYQGEHIRRKAGKKAVAAAK